MLEQVLSFAPIGKYLVIGLGIVGIIALVVGIYRKDRNTMVRGGYMLVLAIVIWVCAQLLFSISIDRANRKMYEIQQQYGY